MQDVEEVFARRLRELREARKLSQARLAAELAAQRGLELDPTAITRIERGQRGISLGEAAAIASVLGTSIDDMCEASQSRSVRDLRRELAAAADQLVNAEVVRETADRNYAEMRAHVQKLTEQLAEMEAAGGAAAPSRKTA